MRFFDSEYIRIPYRAKRLITGLSDVKIDIWNNAREKVITAGTMTELGNGEYYYDHKPDTIGNFTYRAWCDSQPHDVKGSFESVGINSLYYRRGTGGGTITMPGRAAVKGITQDDLKDIAKAIKGLADTVSKLAVDVQEIKGSIDDQDAAIISAMSNDELEDKVMQ